MSYFGNIDCKKKKKRVIAQCRGLVSVSCKTCRNADFVIISFKKCSLFTSGGACISLVSVVFGGGAEEYLVLIIKYTKTLTLV